MDTSKLKHFAPECREQLIEQVGVKLDYVLTTRTPDLAAQESLVKALQRAVDGKGRGIVIEEVAYTWFNRLAALRYLDARGWHPFRMRVLTPTNEDDTQPELLRQIRQGIIPEELRDYVSAQRVNDLLDGKLPSPNPQAEVQRLVVIGVCQYYAFLLPDLFERIDDFTRLLLPDDLLTEHSVVHGFRTGISDEDCAEVEVLGWLYQFYISEKKDEVMARKKAVPSEDIPAVTQLFTPHWIVRYLVENSLGRLWLNSRPDSGLREHMPYYVEDAEAEEVGSQKSEASGAESVPVVREDRSGDKSYGSDLKLNTENLKLTVDRPEEIKLLDPACGSGHMLTYAFDLLVKIYEEEGHAPSEIPEKILTHNLFGLEICPRAAQLAQFALVCKAREQSRTAFRRPVQPQVMCLRDVVITADEMQAWCEATGVTLSQDELSQVHQFRENTQTFGALIQPELDKEGLAALRGKIGEEAAGGDLLVQSTHRQICLVLDQAEMLSQRYQVVVANPPYMGGSAMNSPLKQFVKNDFEDSKADLFAVFISRNQLSCLEKGFVGMITMHSWMFISGFRALRQRLIGDVRFLSLLHLGARAFDTIGGEVVQSAAFILGNSPFVDRKTTVFRLLAGVGSAAKEKLFHTAMGGGAPDESFSKAFAEFERIPGSPFAYWASDSTVAAFDKLPAVGDIADTRLGMATADNNRFVRCWQEVSLGEFSPLAKGRSEAKESGLHWFPYAKGGDFRKWFGNNEQVVNWYDDGAEIRSFAGANGKIRSHNYNLDFIFAPGITWNALASAKTSMRLIDCALFDNAGSSCFPRNTPRRSLLGFLNSTLLNHFLPYLSPTLNFQPGEIARVPIDAAVLENSDLEKLAACAIDLARADWDNFERSWDFRDLPLLRPGDWEVEPGQVEGDLPAAAPWKGRTLAESWDNYDAYCSAAIRRMQELETENNRLWINAYGLHDELTPKVPEDEITLARADQKTDMAAFLSYAVGCMMGRYSLDQPGLILADAGDTLERYFEKVEKSADKVTFLPDDDAIIPITEDDWFEDDAASRVREFLKVTFGSGSLEENVAFLEESLGKDLRKYFTANTGGFYADHVKTYKKRPIYWMFESPKKHFRALIYLHRYTKDTVSTLLNGYLREFHHKLKARIDDLQHTIDSASTSAGDKTRAQKAQDKSRAALRDVEEYERDILLPLAQQRLEIDLDDGVKANYPKFGKALAKVPGLS